MHTNVGNRHRCNDSLGTKDLAALYVDFEKAFNKINPAILLKKLWAMGIHGKHFALIKDYLTGKMQCVKVKDILSLTLPI